MEDYARSVAPCGTSIAHVEAGLSGIQAVRSAPGSRRGYNVFVPPSASTPRKGKSRILSAEATGVLLIALLILIITVVRYWRSIPWGAR
jgi:hypothetical protein